MESGAYCVSIRANDQCSDSLETLHSGKTNDWMEQNIVNCMCVVILVLAVFFRGHTRKRRKSHIEKGQNKACKSCFFCKSLVFSSSCRKCPQCCLNSTCGRTSERLASHGASLKGVSILNDHNLPFKVKSYLTRNPLIKSGYANPLRNSYLQETLRFLLDKQAIMLVKVQSSLALYNRLFLVPKPNKMHPILDLSSLNKFLKVQTFNLKTQNKAITARMGNLSRIQRHLLSHPWKSELKKVCATVRIRPSSLQLFPWSLPLW